MCVEGMVRVAWARRRSVCGLCVGLVLRAFDTAAVQKVSMMKPVAQTVCCADTPGGAMSRSAESMCVEVDVATLRCQIVVAKTLGQQRLPVAGAWGG